MNTMLFAIKDQVAGLIAAPPFINKSTGAAVRYFRELLGNKELNLGKYPRDYDLLMIGTMNDQTGELTPQVPPTTVESGSEWANAIAGAGALPLFTQEQK